MGSCNYNQGCNLTYNHYNLPLENCIKKPISENSFNIDSSSKPIRPCPHPWPSDEKELERHFKKK